MLPATVLINKPLFFRITHYLNIEIYFHKMLEELPKLLTFLIQQFRFVLCL